MNNSKTLIRSSIVSLLIVALGLFLLCVSRAPRIETNDSVVGKSDAGNGSAADEQTLMALLNEADGEISQSTSATELSAASGQPNSDQTNSDNELGSLLSEANDAFANDPSSQSNDGTDELMKLLQDDNAGQNQPLQTAATTDNSQDVAANQPQDDLNQLLGASDGQNQQNDTSLAAINDEIHHLENVLNEKTSLKQQLQQQIQQYDQKIAKLEARLTSPASENNYYAGEQSTTDQGYSETSASSSNITLNSNRPIDDYEISYKDALQLFNEHRYQNAIDQFYALLQINPNHKLADNCQYWIGECYYAQGKYYQAIAEFNKVAAFDAADKKDDAQLMLGLCFLKVGDTDVAQTELNWLIGAFANSEYVNKAYRYLKQL
ncbi:MAG: tetratricopeptide repeat protein [Calditrichaeota bacterium]|nr:tetratricopeptide repeat protein [Calditrichota bacterium]